VIVWPVVVQGESAAAQVARAIAGFNGLPPDGPVPRPAVLIVARGGGSIEDLWPFNDEALARAAAASTIPLISAVGHETDTTLIDHAAARRAPTPTAAAEMATPVLADLRASLSVAGGRLDRAVAHGLEGHRTRLAAATAALPRLADLVELAGQRFDFAASRLAAALAANVAVQAQRLTGVAARLTLPLLSRPVDLAGQRLGELGGRLGAAMARQQAITAQRADLPGLGLRMQQAVHRRLSQEAAGLDRLEQLRRSVDPDRPLSLGFARVHRSDGALVTGASALSAGDGLRLVFADGDREVTVNGGGPSRKPPPAASPAPGTGPQGTLFD
jgi:exodeoxyribonuclease VII large subunit